MIFDLETRELPPDVIAMTFTGRFILGNRLSDVEHAIREQIQQGAKNLVPDFSGLNYIDSAGIGVVSVCIGLVEEEGGQVAIAGAGGRVKHLLELTHLNQVVGTYPDLSSAHSAPAWTNHPAGVVHVADSRNVPLARPKAETGAY